ncbi:putative bifunctional diguanylate cyclase/phosphodiesterase [Hoeflea prorocentri]|uniref:EAL domain-containing protein n=1 Tax=Hoeflea prorocentri TaxID=1922333 RepID=A0A9X3UIC0_9HYPH|nr:EAL domain-containing protein [Hoeflea prorocentri]MCY6381187.1 EAL domain-containing protein [Hoeflea prorocentri]MDA5398987.1 EAL domain-containing protein [Hoeflea prorocentri]
MRRLFGNIRKDPEHRIRIAYRLVLLAMIGLLATSHVAIIVATERSQHYALAFKDISNERMLSQRIVLLSQHALNEADAVTREETLRLVKEALLDLEAVHTDLAKKVSDEAENNAASRQVNEVFFSWPAQLDYQIRSLITNTNQFLNFAMSSPDIAAIYMAPMEDIATSQVLPALDEVNDIYQDNTKSAVELFKQIQLALLFLSLGMLIVVWRALFRPLAAQIGQRTRELIVARDDMQYAANHDGLTGLANRDFALQKIEEVTEHKEEKVAALALLLLDLDDFKNINDSYGHQSGDRLLCTVANRLRSVLGDEGLACRMGGDEFLVIVEGEASVDNLPQIADRILKRMNTKVPLGGAATYVKASIGIARFPKDGSDTEHLLTAADLALYAAKKAGKGTYQFFNEDMQRELIEAKVLEHDIDDALRSQQFIPVFQPQVDITTGTVVGVEVLVRWHHPRRGVLLPGDFLDAAASLGRMPEITRMVLDQAFAAASNWQQNGVKFGRMAVNFSQHDLMWNSFLNNLISTAEDHGLTSDCIAVEVVESVAIKNDSEQAAQALYNLRKKGFQIEIDDFGTGFASLSHLNRNLFDRVKIDRQFVADIDTSERRRIIVDSIIRLARALNLKVVAEGLERQQEIDTLTKLGCKEFQGNAIAPPMPENVAREWLLAHDPSAVKAMAQSAVSGNA